MVPGKVTIFIMWLHPDGWKRDKGLVNSFYNERRSHLLSPSVKPNKAHYALAGVDEYFEFNIVTPNISDLHKRAGSKSVNTNAWLKSSSQFSVKKIENISLNGKKISLLMIFALSAEDC